VVRHVEPLVAPVLHEVEVELRLASYRGRVSDTIAAVIAAQAEAQERQAVDHSLFPVELVLGLAPDHCGGGGPTLGKVKVGAVGGRRHGRVRWECRRRWQNP